MCVLEFLSLPLIGVDSIQMVQDKAARCNVDEHELLAQYTSELHMDMTRLSAEITQYDCQIVNTVFLEPWSKIYINKIMFNVFDHFGSDKKKDVDTYNIAMHKYWVRIATHHAAESAKIAAGDTSHKAYLVNNMLKKVEWIRSGHLFEYESYMAMLPLLTCSLLPNVLQLFTNDLLSIENVLMEVSCCTLAIHDCSFSHTLPPDDCLGGASCQICSQTAQQCQMYTCLEWPPQCTAHTCRARHGLY